MSIFSRIIDYFIPVKAIELSEPLYFRDMDLSNLSDGYHTFEELYDHRNILWITLCKALKPEYVWKTRFHSDGTYYPGYFLLGYRTKQGRQISYHLPMKMWELCEFAKLRLRAPKYDGHTSQDVLQRLKKLR